MAEAVDDIAVMAPRVPVLSTLTGEPLGTADEVRGNLSAALTSCVDWIAVTAAVRALTPDLLLECGPTTVLRDLTRSLWPGVRAHAVTDPAAAALLGDRSEEDGPRERTLRAMRLVVGTPRLDQAPLERRRTKDLYGRLRELLDAGSADTAQVDRLLHEALRSKGLDEGDIVRITGGAR